MKSIQVLGYKCVQQKNNCLCSVLNSLPVFLQNLVYYTITRADPNNPVDMRFQTVFTLKHYPLISFIVVSSTNGIHLVVCFFLVRYIYLVPV